MEAKKLAIQAVEDAFKSDIMKLFSNLIVSIAQEGDSPQGADRAGERFRRGLDVAVQALEQARKAIAE